MLQRHIKGLLDSAGALLLLVLLLPVLGAIGVAVWLQLGAPVLFRQERPGLAGRPFVLFKFRTMRQGPGAEDDRLSDFGRFLRRWSLDELPELWNVLKGDMSLVGPRPLLMQYLGRYTPHQFLRHEVKPGLTGWAQVNGRNTLTWDQKFALDVWYVENWSLWLDANILARTLWQLVRPRGIAHEGSATMPEFKGSSESSIFSRDHPE
jgi:sugar transferase EpsL